MTRENLASITAQPLLVTEGRCSQRRGADVIPKWLLRAFKVEDQSTTVNVRESMVQDATSRH